jgi:Gametolysin peptidase M11
MYISNEVHETGHNLGLQHSAQGDVQYGDQSGTMGYGYGK